MTTSPSKQCNRCMKVKPLDEFFLNKNMPDGHLNQCKGCYTKKSKTVVCDKCKHLHHNSREGTAECDLGGRVRFYLTKLTWRGDCPLEKEHG